MGEVVVVGAADAVARGDRQHAASLFAGQDDRGTRFLKAEVLRRAIEHLAVAPDVDDRDIGKPGQEVAGSRVVPDSRFHVGGVDHRWQWASTSERSAASNARASRCRW